jgi:hypothetical protein
MAAGNPPPSTIPSDYRPLPGSELGPADPTETVSVTIVLRRRPDGPPVPDHAYFATTPLNRRRRLSQAEFAANYGAAPDDLAQVTDFARSHNLTVVTTHAARRTVVVSGTVAQVSDAFAVAFGSYEHVLPGRRGAPGPTERYRGRDGFVHVPQALADIVVGVFGLDNRRITRRNMSGGDPPYVEPLTPAAVAQLYNFPSNEATGQTIAIASPTGGLGGYLPSDLELTFGGTPPPITPVLIANATNAAFVAYTSADAQVGQSELTFQSTAGMFVGSLVAAGSAIAILSDIYITGFSGTTVTLSQPVAAPITAGTTPIYINYDIEAMLDIFVSASAAPGVGVAVYFSNDDQAGWVGLIQRVVHPDPGDPICSVLSSSAYFVYGDDAATLMNAGITTDFVGAVSAALQDAALQGVTVCFASGDGGSLFDGQYYHVEYPPSDPWVLSVGGTTLGGSTSLPPPFVEYVWNDASGATGGGVSAFFALPAYQEGAGVPGSLNDGFIGRGIPDVAANASTASGYEFYVANLPLLVGGTSAAAPLWAALIAVLNAALGQSVGFINPMLYALGNSVFNNIVPPPGPTDNGFEGAPGYPAQAGWDACTGWGSPNGTALLSALQDQLAQDCYFVVEQSTFSIGAVAAELQEAAQAVYRQAFFVIVDGFTLDQLGATPPAITGLPSGMSVAPGAVQPTDPGLPNAPQRCMYPFDVTFTSTASFPATVTATATVTAIVDGVPATVSSSALFELSNAPAPYFAGASGITWLSADLRVFQVTSGTPLILPVAGANPQYYTLNNTGDPTSDATTFIQTIIYAFNLPDQPAPPNHPFDAIPTGEAASALDLLPTDAANNPVYNFAVARVRYTAASASAQNVRVFFRLVPALTTALAYDPATAYRRWSDGVEFGQAIPLFGVDTSGDVIAIPCFAQPRIDASQDPLTAQTDPANVQTIAADAGTEVCAYFGCWLDINQPFAAFPPSVAAPNLDGPFPAASLQPVQMLLRGQHQCLVAEIAFDPDPIPDGYSPSTTGPLAQRNLALIDGIAPDFRLTLKELVSSTFTVRPTPSTSAVRPSELAISWGDLPPDCTATITWPTGGTHTFRTPAHSNSYSYIGIPTGSGATLPGLLSVELPLQAGTAPPDITIVVRQLADAPVMAGGIHIWGRVLGAFQITLRVLPPSATPRPVSIRQTNPLVALMRLIEGRIPPASRWLAVFKQYVAQISEHRSVG